MKSILAGLFSGFVLFAFGQFPERTSSSELYHQLLKASNTASILYMAAHPDDENTRLISYFENHLHARTAYLSLTRGSGGQNLIGTEIGSAIGILRTRELLAARKIDGGEQYFTRAVDFGYSKSADEAFDKWGKEEILHDVVWVIRKFRPDVIVTRFPPTNYAGHGHHQASAILAEEAFDLAADPEAFPEQLEFVDVWQPKRLYFNTSTWWVEDLADRAKNSDDYLTINVGQYNPILGESYGQIAARSRSQHKSQGFGADYPMGNQIEYLKYVKGSKSRGGILEGVASARWTKDLPLVKDALDTAIENFDFTDPSQSAPEIIRALNLLRSAETTPLIERKIEELQNILLQLSGIEWEASADQKFTTPGDTLRAEIKINKKSDVRATIVSIKGHPFAADLNHSLIQNDLYFTEATLIIDDSAEYGNPYWLKEPYENLYTVQGYENLGKPENDPQVFVWVEMNIDGYSFEQRLPVKFKVVDPAKAVLYSPVYIVPEVTAGFEENTLVTTGKENKEITVTAQCHVSGLSGILRPVLPTGWISSPPQVELSFTSKGETRLEKFTIIPEEKPSRGEISLELELDEDSSGLALMNLRVIDYDHIPAQIELSPSAVEIIPIDLDRGGVEKIGYLEGPGDEVAKYLEAIGYGVEIIDEAELIGGNLDQYDAIVTGIRAYNTREDLAYAQKALNQYVEEGGTWVVQYNTTRGLKTDQIGPFAFKLSRERVTDETAQPHFLASDHPVLNVPNQITAADFEGWVQERGLYFAGEWDNAFTPILEWSDEGEPPRQGGLIIASYGEGYFVYTGISFFRELPAGVPGAYRLIANILSLSKSNNDGRE